MKLSVAADSSGVSASLEARIKRAIEEMPTNPELQKKSIETIRKSGLAAVPYIVKYMDDDRELPVKHIMVNIGAWEVSHFGPRSVAAALTYLIIEIITPSPSIRSTLSAIGLKESKHDDPDEEEIRKWRQWCANQWPDMADTCWNNAASDKGEGKRGCE